MEIAKTIKKAADLIKTARRRNKIIGFVPTMGALHKGHCSLMETSVKKCGCTVVSIFVNPTQFGPREDFKNYPRTLSKDLEICEDKGVDLVFVPTVKQMYHGKNLTWVKVEKLTLPLCGRFRPGHFDGVTTICAKLFNIVNPDFAFFGQKDAQQAIVLKTMVDDLNFPLKIITCPTIREKDGLAVSSRNKYLTPEQRKQAPVIYKALCNARNLIQSGTKNTERIKTEIKNTIEKAASAEIQYIDILDAGSLEELENIKGKTLIAVAVLFGPARLIDNILIDTKS